MTFYATSIAADLFFLPHQNYVHQSRINRQTLLSTYYSSPHSTCFTKEEKTKIIWYNSSKLIWYKILNSATIKRKQLSLFSSLHRWYVTGFPFENRANFSNQIFRREKDIILHLRKKATDFLPYTMALLLSASLTKENRIGYNPSHNFLLYAKGKRYPECNAFIGFDMV